MKTKMILKTIFALMTIILLIIIGIVLYFFLTDIESKPPEEIQEEYNIEEKELLGRKVFIISQKENKSNKKILYFHGGSYVAETSNLHWKFLKDLVKDTGATIILPDYPLTPKYNYKDVFTMVKPLYREIIDRVESENFIMIGDSAGGGIALALAETMGEENAKQPEKLILISPWLDVRLENPEIDEVQKNDKQLNKETLKIAGIAYSGEDGINSYLTNPIDGPLDELKNVIIYTGTYDILNADVEKLVERAKNEGVEINLKEYKKATHIWLLERGENKTQDAENAYQDLINEINEP